jgi:hypothetical protein
VLRDI